MFLYPPPSCIIYHSSIILFLMTVFHFSYSLFLRPWSFVLHPMYFVLGLLPFIIRPWPVISCPVPFNLHNLSFHVYLFSRDRYHVVLLSWPLLSPPCACLFYPLQSAIVLLSFALHVQYIACSPVIPHQVCLIIDPTLPFALCPSPDNLDPSSYWFYPSPFSLYHSVFALRPWSFIRSTYMFHVSSIR